MTNKTHKYYEYMDICRTHGLFTCGTTEQYNDLAELYTRVPNVNSLSFIALCYGTWLCSDHDLFDLGTVRGIFITNFSEEE